MSIKSRLDWSSLINKINTKTNKHDIKDQERRYSSGESDSIFEVPINSLETLQ